MKESGLASKKVTIYTDGACLGNPGPGGYGLVLLYNGHRRELSGGYRRTTNNRMEIMAVLVALKALKEPCHVELYSDSQYVVNAMNKGWARKWRARGWKRGENEPAKNPDLWAELLDTADQHRVTFKWIKGHAGHRENERCDQLALEAAKKPHLPIDKGYEKPRNGR